MKKLIIILIIFCGCAKSVPQKTQPRYRRPALDYVQAEKRKEERKKGLALIPAFVYVGILMAFN